MNTSKLLLITTIAMTLSHSVMAENNENNMPPAGPYQSADETAQNNNGVSSVQSNSQIRNIPAQYSQEMPEWVKQRRAQMEQRMKQNNNQSEPEWVKQRQAQMEQWMKQNNNQPQPEWVKQRQAQMEQWMKQNNNQPQPEWVKQRQAQMEQMMQPPQSANNPWSQWNQNQRPAMPRPDIAAPQNNRNQQYFPSARGPVYGPGVPPPAFNGQPGYQPQRQWNPNPYPPVRR